MGPPEPPSLFGLRFLLIPTLRLSGEGPRQSHNPREPALLTLWELQGQVDAFSMSERGREGQRRLDLIVLQSYRLMADLFCPVMERSPNCHNS